MSRRAGVPVHNKVVFKDYNHKQSMLPLDIDTSVPDKHMVRIINKAVDDMDMTPLFAMYPGGGRSSFHPAMMTKLLVYAYADKVYSSRRIAKAARENIMYMWLCRGQAPDFKTINSFRGERMKEVFLHVFSEVVELLLMSGYIKQENYFVDGTKIEANANKYSAVWSKNVKRYKELVRKKCKEIIEMAETANEAEEEAYGDNDLEELGDGREIDSASIEDTVKRIDERLSQTEDKVKTKKLKRAKKELESSCLPKMKRYEEQEKLLSGRNSYSKTDTDATFLMMKEDVCGKGQPKAGYNAQIGTENQYVIGFSIHQSAADVTCLKQHLKRLSDILKNKLPINIVGDAGYGGEENYEYLKDNQLGNYLKYNTFDKEQSSKWRNDPLKTQNWKYDESIDAYQCAGGRHLNFSHEEKQQSAAGYESSVRIYKSNDCHGCLYKADCVKSPKAEAVRQMQVNRRGSELRGEAKNNLNSPNGKKLRARRSVEVESVFGDIKANGGVRRFTLRGCTKVDLEFGLHCIGHNFRKLAIAQSRKA